jgi:GDP-L-fucose synthase
VTGFSGELKWNTSMPDGTPRKLLDIGRIRSIGWAPKIGLKEGIRSAYAWFLANEQTFKR